MANDIAIISTGRIWGMRLWILLRNGRNKFRDILGKFLLLKGPPSLTSIGVFDQQESMVPAEAIVQNMDLPTPCGILLMAKNSSMMEQTRCLLDEADA